MRYADIAILGQSTKELRWTTTRGSGNTFVSLHFIALGSGAGQLSEKCRRAARVGTGECISS